MNDFDAIMAEFESTMHEFERTIADYEAEMEEYRTLVSGTQPEADNTPASPGTDGRVEARAGAD